MQLVLQTPKPHIGLHQIGCQPGELAFIDAGNTPAAKVIGFEGCDLPEGLVGDRLGIPQLPVPGGQAGREFEGQQHVERPRPLAEVAEQGRSAPGNIVLRGDEHAPVQVPGQTAQGRIRGDGGGHPGQPGIVPGRQAGGRATGGQGGGIQEREYPGGQGRQGLGPERGIAAVGGGFLNVLQNGLCGQSGVHAVGCFLFERAGTARLH
jgi:hypothetical protein